ncbi:MAG: hypothetical protein M5U08_07350 [Burkholderiales bacterium]|nr:hypothetical protein [Burkholderiales bacterium]
MLKVFTRAGPAQSLADSKERDRFLRQVAALEPHRALEELRRRVGLVAGDSSVRPEARAGIVYALDSAGAGPVQRIGGEYLLAARLSKSQEMLLWDSLHGFCAATARAYLDCFDGVAPSVRAATEHKTFAAPIAVRALRALGQQLKLEHVRYGPLDPDIWTNVARVYGRIEAAGIARLPVPEAPGAPARITPETEFVRIAMFSVCSPGSLLPLQIEVADRLTGRYARLFKISRRRSAATPYRFDLDQGSPRCGASGRPRVAFRRATSGRRLPTRSWSA